MIVPYIKGEHEPKILDLINFDRLPGQPYCTSDMLSDAEAGVSYIDSGWWQALQKPEIYVSIFDKEIQGVISFAYHKAESEAFILWSHTTEDREITRSIYNYTISSIKNVKKINAFYIASALTCGLEGLPRFNRPITHSVLLDNNFRQMDLWSYRRLNLENYSSSPIKKLTLDLFVERNENGWKISKKDNGVEISFCNADLVQSSIGVIWMIDTLPEYRRKGIGRAVLEKSIDVLKKAGAKEIILYVDDDASPNDDRDRRPAIKLYENLGILEVDRLYSYDRKF